MSKSKKHDVITFSLFRVTWPISDFFLVIIFKMINDFTFYGPRRVLGAKMQRWLKHRPSSGDSHNLTGGKGTRNQYGVGLSHTGQDGASPSLHLGGQRRLWRRRQQVESEKMSKNPSDPEVWWRFKQRKETCCGLWRMIYTKSGNILHSSKHL